MASEDADEAVITHRREWSASDFAGLLHGRSANNLADELIRLIESGVIAPGDRMPTVRSISSALSMSPVTISQAWHILRDRGIVEGQSRNGITVAKILPAPRPRHYEDALQNDAYAWMQHDLRYAIADPRWLPSPSSMFADMEGIEEVNTYKRNRIQPELEILVRKQWPYLPREFMIANGGYEAMSIALHAFIHAGEHVLVETPAPPRQFDLIESVGGRPTPVECDGSGMVPESLRQALEMYHPTAVVIQPSVQNPTGRIMSKERAQRLTEMLKAYSACDEGRDFHVIEDDAYGQLYEDCLRSLVGQGAPGVMIRTYSKTHGPDLRLAAVEGNNYDISRMAAYLSYGAAWTSRFLQRALAHALRNPEDSRRIADARRHYEEKQHKFAKELMDAGITVRSMSGFSLWIPVEDETRALVALASRGIAVQSGSKHALHPLRKPHIRVCILMESEDDFPFLASSIATAAGFHKA